MNCMKCGQEIQSGQVFCPECLAGMEKYPVKPDAVVLLPKRPAYPAVKRTAPKKRFRNPDEQIAHLHRVIRWLALALVCLTLALIVVSAVSIHFMGQEEVASYLGRNYSTVTPGSALGK